jgi:hypothetical protein
MTPQSAAVQAVSEIYELLLLAAARRQPVVAIYDGLLRLLCPQVLGRKSGRRHVFCYQFGGNSARVALRWRQKEGAAGAASPWRNSAKSSCARTHGTPSHAPRGKPALMILISMPTLSLETTRKKGSEAVAAVTGAPERCAASRLNADYVARDVRGDPRGQKSGAGPGAMNPR